MNNNFHRFSVQNVIFLLCLIFLVSAAPVSAKAESADSGKLSLFCLKNGVLKVFSPIGLRSSFQNEMDFSKKVPDAYSVIEEIDWDRLIQYDKQDADEDARRTGSKVIKRTCGVLNVEISTGYFNSNPQGAGGGDDNYPTVSVFYGKTILVFYGKTILVDKIKLGFCEVDKIFYQGCPDNWASRILINPIDSENIRIDMVRNYTESKKIVLQK